MSRDSRRSEGGTGLDGRRAVERSVEGRPHLEARILSGYALPVNEGLPFRPSMERTVSAEVLPVDGGKNAGTGQVRETS